VSGQGWATLGTFLGLVLALAWPLGWYLARVYRNERIGLDAVLGPLERFIYRVLRVDPGEQMGWKGYAAAVLGLNALGGLALFAILLLQGVLPYNPLGRPGLSWHLAFDTAVSFATNTNWQAYSGEQALSPLSQMAGLTVQNFLSAATGIAVLVALIRGLNARQAERLGCFWVDLTRTVLYVLLPLALVVAVAISHQGVPQTLAATTTTATLEGGTQTLLLGPVASQIAIKQLGSNGGGYYSVNSAHPLENPTPLSGVIELLAILLIPAALVFAFGRMVGDQRQAWLIILVMTLIFAAGAAFTMGSEEAGSPALAALGLDQAPSPFQSGGNMEGKEARFGPLDSALWAVSTTATSNGSVDSMHDSFTPLGGLVLVALMIIGEVIFGGVGSGLYGMLIFVVLAVFIAGLMVGRTPEYLGKKIEPFEMKMAALAVLFPAAAVLIATAIASLSSTALAGLNNSGPHGFSELLYAASSASNNNGSAFAGLDVNHPLMNVLLGICMLAGRFGVALPVLAIAGSLARKQRLPESAGTLPTHTPLFGLLLTAVIVLVGALTFLPALALGPIVEHLILSQ
jgi:K+-transporting ATPase ATPase A chain